jgi:N-acetylmuramoyl-L-alanine amidase
MPRVTAAIGFCLFVMIAAWAQSVRAEPVQKHYTDDDLQCLAATMYFEARAEGTEGMRAVAAVVLNRVRHPAFPQTICGVVHQGGEQAGCQFSYWCDGKSDIPKNAKVWTEAKALAREILSASIADPTGGALFFHAKFIPTPWVAKRTRTVQIGRHIFYR